MQKALPMKLMILQSFLAPSRTNHSMEAIQITFEWNCHWERAQKKIYEFLNWSNANKKILPAQMEIPFPISAKKAGRFAKL